MRPTGSSKANDTVAIAPLHLVRVPFRDISTIAEPVIVFHPVLLGRELFRFGQAYARRVSRIVQNAAGGIGATEDQGQVRRVRAAVRPGWCPYRCPWKE
ncbi:hypothetical protein PUNSTDRAFT_51926 [Punctularia strigosozonata HHB-11173 SS5]|uniref:uncharacterized protein n=1 Tax=Punctularia strigosozonata (strain HHB-11173) TaxID=741275 RepID=UPI0004417B21|nr:uncharacterized protein PUNSTDRAFT_51926 [Punctularia strigosozonata HHB-11173 SS5]EIN09756.1 hypothetical protein PUNSTDRAFT_51926 [Punctularia strigosozonata HHB-11173 SS5]